MANGEVSKEFIALKVKETLEVVISVFGIARTDQELEPFRERVFCEVVRCGGGTLVEPLQSHPWYETFCEVFMPKSSENENLSSSTASRTGPRAIRRRVRTFASFVFYMRDASYAVPSATLDGIIREVNLTHLAEHEAKPKNSQTNRLFLNFVNETIASNFPLLVSAISKRIPNHAGVILPSFDVSPPILDIDEIFPTLEKDPARVLDIETFIHDRLCRTLVSIVGPDVSVKESTSVRHCPGLRYRIRLALAELFAYRLMNHDKTEVSSVDLRSNFLGAQYNNDAPAIIGELSVRLASLEDFYARDAYLQLMPRIGSKRSTSPSDLEESQSKVAKLGEVEG